VRGIDQLAGRAVPQKARDCRVGIKYQPHDGLQRDRRRSRLESLPASWAGVG
jgi:hypothetical protein